MNPFDLPGPQYLAFQVVLLAFAGVMAAIVRRIVTGPEDELRELPALTDDEKACLSGGAAGLVNGTLSRMVQDGTLQVNGGVGSQNAVLEVGASPFSEQGTLASDLYQAVADHDEKARTAAIRAAAKPTVDACVESLRERGLVLTSAAAWQSSVLPLMVMGVAIGCGAYKVWVGLARDKPVWWLTFLILGSLLLSLKYLWRPVFRTGLGEAVVKQLKVEHAALESQARTAPLSLSGPELALAVGLFGVAILDQGPLSRVTSALAAPHAVGGSCGGSSCGGGSDCGGGSCGGGGCGGCGGGGD